MSACMALALASLAAVLESSVSCTAPPPVAASSPAAGHTGKITGLAIDPWGRFVLTSSADGTAKVWDLSSARAIHTFVSAATPEQGELGG